jgi:hypothetical protein
MSNLKNSALETFIDPISGAQVKSDRVYRVGSRVFDGLENVGYFDFLAVNPTAVEYELSKKHFIVTTKGSFTDFDDVKQDAVIRQTYSGDFRRSRKNGAVTGTVRFYTTGEYETKSFSRRFPWRENEFIASLKDRKIKGDFRSPLEFQFVVTGLASVEPSVKTTTLWYRRNINQAFIDADIAGGFYANYDTDKSGLKSIGVSTFYLDNWWNNPFTSNLV